MSKKKPKPPQQQIKRDDISWKPVIGILGSIAVLVGAIVSGLDFIQYLRAGYQEFLWLGGIVLVLVWLIVLWLLIKKKNIYWILWLAVTVIAGVVVWGGWNSYIKGREEKLIVMIAAFEGPEEVYGLRNEIIETLNADFSGDEDIEIIPVHELVTLTGGSEYARELGEQALADVVIWGWYRPTENPNVTIHIENLSTEQLLPIEESLTLQPAVALAELESFSFQQQAGLETSALISFLAGFIEYQAKNYEIALKRFDRALDNLSENLRLLNNRAALYFYRGNVNLFTNHVQEAIQDYDQVIEINPQYAGAYSNRGLAYAHLEDYQRAIQDFDLAIAINPHDAETYSNRGIAYAERENYLHAIQDFDQAISINPQYAEAYFNRGNAYLKLGDLQRAIQDYDHAIEINPRFAAAYLARGDAYNKLGDPQRAIQDYDLSWLLSPSAQFARKKAAPLMKNRWGRFLF